MKLQTRTGLGMGVDIGGSGIKGAPVDFARGVFADDRHRIPTPDPSTPDAVVDVVARVVAHFPQVPAGQPVGVTFPAVIHNGVARTAANVAKSWIDTDVDALMTQRLGREVHVVNDADAAGLAEVHYGAAQEHPGLVIMVTLGTGIGTALIMNGMLIPNTELGHIEIDGEEAEKRAAASVRDAEDLSWPAWAKRLQKYLRTLEDLLWPDLFVVGGGVSRRSKKFLPLISTRTPVVAATLHNNGGIIGAASLAAQRSQV